MNVRRIGLINTGVFALLAAALVAPSPIHRADIEQADGTVDEVVTYVTSVEFVDGSKIEHDLSTGLTSVLDNTPLQSLADLALGDGSVSFGATTPGDGTETLPADGGDNLTLPSLGSILDPWLDLLPLADTAQNEYNPPPETTDANTAPASYQTGGLGGTDLALASNTPEGYTLQGNNRVDDYHYKSDPGKYAISECRGPANGPRVCKEFGAVLWQYKETLFGGDSNRWRHTMDVRYVKGPRYNARFDYWCGVAIPNARDVTCRTEDSTADRSGEGWIDIAWYDTQNTSGYITPSFGENNLLRTKFPMIKANVCWPDYPDSTCVTKRLRGWDIKRIRKSSGAYEWRMANASGTGR